MVQVEDGQSREEALCWSLGVDGTYGWHVELPSAESLRHPVENWVARGLFLSIENRATCLPKRGAF